MAISRAEITRAGGLAAVAGGLLRIAASVAPVVIESDFARESLYIVVDLCLISGLLAFYASQSRHAGWPGDRKSTRLNSSHVEISYAVFCLKKKKKICIKNMLYKKTKITKHKQKKNKY